MSIGLIAGFIFFCMGFSATLLSNLFTTKMIGEINRKREEGNFISYFGFTPAKILRIHLEYRRLYPGGKLDIYALAFFGVGMLCMFSVLVCLYSIR